MMAVDIDTTRQFEAGVPRALFRRGALVSVPGRPYDVSKDGKRFLVNLPPEQSAPAPLTVIVNSRRFSSSRGYSRDVPA